ncbi:hypothetical protein [Mycobacterium sp. PSTR-4-N]|uniref:hypothetical protein n=1 Tax=Mycobacterium sp. PSTR-4-N TaxID=2917745 RepID=UPI001F14AE9E|nr:hypothetical protein [Mycobacterium sp. PSTR-4-N]MCG7595765.1 hypothetical protein [Mycobacterium sp. PSTR-4-N]
MSLTQPIATLIASGFTLAGAGIAFWAVNRQIKAAAQQQEKNRQAEWARTRRSEMLDVLMEAARIARHTSGIATNFELRVEEPQMFANDAQPLQQQLDELKNDFYALEAGLLVAKLDLLGLEGVSSALNALEEEASDVVLRIEAKDWTVYEKEEAVLAAIKNALRQPG